MSEVPTNRQIEETARKYLKDRIKGSIFVKMKEKNDTASAAETPATETPATETPATETAF